MGPADATDVTDATDANDAGAVAPVPWHLTVIIYCAAVQGWRSTHPHRQGTASTTKKFVRMPRQKRHSDAAQKDLHKCDKAASR
jgi:hypothetical protein